MKLEEVKVGDKLVADSGFSCIDEGSVLTVMQALGEKYVSCRFGNHYLVAECNGDLVGFSKE